MFKGFHLVVVITVIGLSSAFQGRLEDRINHYETLHPSDITHHVVKRSVHITLNQKIISLSTLNKHFRLHLQTQRGLFSSDFQAIVQDGSGSVKKVDVDTREFYEGYVEGDSTSRVHAHWEGHDLAAVIKTKEDTYVIEPSLRLLPKSKEFSMISYKMSDMKEKIKEDLGKSFCGYVNPEKGTDDAAANDYLTLKLNDTQNVLPIRNKRQSSTRTICTVALVADYHFYQQVGQSSETTTINYMVASLAFSNDAFITSDFGSGMGTGFGLQVKKVIVNTAATPVNNGGIHYNMQVNSGSDWVVGELLKSFSKENWADVCLAQLYTHQDFSSGILGLGWIASSASGTTGGICSAASGNYYYNTAFSSSMNSGGNRLTTFEANLVATHEFGHNWGSPHDPGTCAPSIVNGGKYIMYQFSVNGLDDNNQLFSPCSRDTMGAVMAAKKDRCFVDPDAEVCGNGVLETGEECDAGTTGLAGNDLCCSSTCTLNANYICSDYNHACCNQCQYALSSQQCGFTGSLTASCQQDVFCNGSSYNCPTALNKADNTSCGNGGECQIGVCLSFCEVKGLLDCDCDGTVLSCKRCCKNGATGTCEAYHTGNNVYTNVPDGYPCIIGYCGTGECIKQVVTTNQRTWDLISSLATSNILEFMRSNIVLTIVVITLVIYIPFVIIILCLDWKNDEKDEDERDWLNRENDKLIRDDADTVIRPTYTRRRAQASRTNRFRRDGTDSEFSASAGRASASGVYVANM